MTTLDNLIRDLPAPDSAVRFWDRFNQDHPSHAAGLKKNEGLMSDVLALAAYSPLLAETLAQNPEYIGWLGRKRADSLVRDKEELLESLARFALTNSQLEPHVMFSRFRRRELLRIFLQDIRRLVTIAEITEEISNLADAIIENALRIARQKIDNRFGSPLETDDKGKTYPADLCVVSLGKLGSRELNYSSDIDLMFIYSADGLTTGNGEGGSITNKEYFAKLAEAVTQMIGKQTGEGAAYRVDLRLRPNGRVGALALSSSETIRYYREDARNWERQTLIRSRSSAGNALIYRQFFDAVEDIVFSTDRSTEEALHDVFLSKEKIDQHHKTGSKLDVKLGKGGIREIEFIAQALQLAYGGSDKWLRTPHTLISITRLADRGYLTKDELSELSSSYELLRRTEHILQMENGLQTHSVPDDVEKRELLARKMNFSDLNEFEETLTAFTCKVHKIYKRVFASDPKKDDASDNLTTAIALGSFADPTLTVAPHPPRTTPDKAVITREKDELLDRIRASSPFFSQMITARPSLADSLDLPIAGSWEDYDGSMLRSVDMSDTFAETLTSLRETWSRHILKIAAADICGISSTAEIREQQTELAKASINAGLKGAALEMQRRYSVTIPDRSLSVLALGKLSSRTLDYGSDLDLILVSGLDETPYYGPMSAIETGARMAEIFMTLLSGMTRNGHLYRVDLRLRPYGTHGPSVVTIDSLADYIASAASIWELLAYVQLRAVDPSFIHTEAAIHKAIRDRVEKEDKEAIRLESRRIRLRLEDAHGKPRRGKEIDIKFGAGGLQDIYFIVRCLHLMGGGVNDSFANSTLERLQSLSESGLISKDDHHILNNGHRCLSDLDHNIRLLFGRSSGFPHSNLAALDQISERMGIDSRTGLEIQLEEWRRKIREVFDRILHK